ncbi:RPR46-like RNAse PH domain-containing protein [Cryptosporidium canis]|uniref:RPR46-like RNAse PH domain-containing protein n=1 Tax=Cryptosporidium canis TaxID=195482 RepID=A0ABQ8P7C0_9CRYT|nr:RPR46-like RNAse PH domain-containing protein [Cryptosporidium canis]KAJ1612525.1 RPR46-like RNAse PH domain-containing protein [Cryptosporidium canis]
MVVRYDGRTNLECGAISASVGVFNSLNGSAEFSIGLSKVIATVWRPEEASSHKCKSYLEVILRPRIGQSQESHKLVEYHMLRLFEKVIDFKPFNRCVISIALQIVSEDGPILPVCINAAVLALIDSGIPMKFFPLAVSIAESNHFYGEKDTSHLLLDPTQSEFLNCTNCSTIVVNTTEKNIFSCVINKGVGVSQNELLDEIHPIILSIATSNGLIRHLSEVLSESIRNKVVRPYNNNLF